jgi:hypothetical protein
MSELTDAIEQAIRALGSNLQAHAPVIELCLEEADRWADELAAWADVADTAHEADSDRQGLITCLHEVANGLAIAGAMAAAAELRGLEHRLRDDTRASASTLARLALGGLAEARRGLRACLALAQGLPEDDATA